MKQDDFVIGKEYEGFRFNRATDLPSLRLKAYEFEHLRSGARLLHCHNDDIENCFAVAFPTPPPDETGLPHITEHSVLAGSEKYPVREPFFELVKMSMATFINAMTAQSYTVYPVATTVKKDFFNLVDVYLDAIFHPQLTRGTFAREGHHLSLTDNSDLSSPLTVSGIVYSEMKGYWSNPDTLLSNLGIRGLYPDTPLGRDSGGNPEHIPELSYEQFKSFYERYYHPSNALIFVYGDIPTREHLQMLSSPLNGFERTTIHIPTPRQSRWTRPRRVEERYPIGPNDDPAGNTYIVMSWLVDDATEPARDMEWSVLSTILLGNEAAPLKKAIIDSKLGADLYSSGDFTHAYETSFEIGIKGSEPGRADAFESFVLRTLESIAASEIPASRIESAFHQVAYHHLEVDTLFPLKMLHLCNEAWCYNKDPLTFFRMEQDLEECRARYETDRELFNRMISDKLLANPHRLRVVLSPDKDVQTRSEAEFAGKMAERRAQLTAEEIADIAGRAAELSASQMQPNLPEQLATLPQLGVADLPAKPRHIPTETGEAGGITLLHNDVFTNGVNYLDINIDLSGLPAELYAWLPRFTEAVSKMGAAGEDYAATAARRAACTGSLHCTPAIFRHAVDPSGCIRGIRIGLKTIDDKAEDALGLLHDLVFALNPRDPERLHSILTQTQAAYRTSLVNDAVHTALRHAGRGLTPESALGYLFASRDALRMVSGMLEDFDDRANNIMNRIEQIRDLLHDAGRWTISFTGSDSVFDLLTRTVRDWTPEFEGRLVEDVAPPFEMIPPPRQGLAAPIKVAHCAKVMRAPGFADPETPLYELGLYLAQFDYMLPEIRLKGNAYGAAAQYNGQQGTLSLYSFNDPRIRETLAAFDGLSGFVQKADWTQTDVDRAIIGSAKQIVQAIRPAQATGQALTRHLCGVTDELREQRYTAARAATPGKIKRALLEQLERAEPDAGVCVAAGRESLEEANRALGAGALEISGILG